MFFDFAADSHWDSEKASVHDDWLVGYFAQVAGNMRRLFETHPSTVPCTVRVGIRVRGSVDLAYGDGMWASKKPLPEDVFFLPDFLVGSAADLDGFFQQAQVDLFSLVNVDNESPYTLLNPHPQPAPAGS